MVAEDPDDGEVYGEKEREEAVAVLVENEDGELLMLQKSGRYPEMGGKWEQPGGTVEDGEDRFEAARRELKEETGLEVEELQDLVRLELEDRNQLLNAYILHADNFSGEVETSSEHQDAIWVGRREAERLDWHRDASYVIPVLRFIENYRQSENNYSGGRELEVVKLLIENEEGRFLAMRKTAEYKIHSGHSYTLYGRMAGKWELPGGKFKESTDRFGASRREVMEETGLELGELTDVFREEIEERNAVNVFILHCDDWEGEVELSKEHVDFRWVSPEEYLEMDWHQDAGYGYPPMEWLDEYLEMN